MWQDRWTCFFRLEKTFKYTTYSCRNILGCVGLCIQIGFLMIRTIDVFVLSLFKAGCIYWVLLKHWKTSGS